MSIPTLPQIKSLSDMVHKSYAEEIKLYVRMNPLEDHIYHFPNPFPEKGNIEGIPGLGIFSQVGDISTMVVAGSAILHHIQKFLERKSPNWNPSDSDVFMLNSPVNQRYSTGKVDFVQAKEKSVEELLTNFDLPCCRAAMAPNLDIWVSIQCLNAIFSRKFIMPAYMKDKDSFTAVLKKYRTVDSSNSEIHGAENMMYDRFLGRIRKYSDRGFGVLWTPTFFILPWIKNRFHYAEWTNNQKDDWSFKVQADVLLVVLERLQNKSFPVEVLSRMNPVLLQEIMDTFKKDADELLLNKKDRHFCDKLIHLYNQHGLSDPLLEFISSA